MPPGAPGGQQLLRVLARLRRLASDPRPFDEIGGLTDMAASANRLAQFVNQVLAETHAPKRDLVPRWKDLSDVSGWICHGSCIVGSSRLHGTN